jgi:hypothetical protein
MQPVGKMSYPTLQERRLAPNLKVQREAAF